MSSLMKILDRLHVYILAALRQRVSEWRCPSCSCQLSALLQLLSAVINKIISTSSSTINNSINHLPSPIQSSPLTGNLDTSPQNIWISVWILI